MMLVGFHGICLLLSTQKLGFIPEIMLQLGAFMGITVIQWYLEQYLMGHTTI